MHSYYSKSPYWGRPDTGCKYTKNEYPSFWKGRGIEWKGYHMPEWTFKWRDNTIHNERLKLNHAECVCSALDMPRAQAQRVQRAYAYSSWSGWKPRGVAKKQHQDMIIFCLCAVAAGSKRYYPGRKEDDNCEYFENFARYLGAEPDDIKSTMGKVRSRV
jgi:hypothetical protein